MLRAGRCAGYRLRKVIDRTPAIDVEAPGTVPPEAMKVYPHPRIQVMHACVELCLFPRCPITLNRDSCTWYRKQSLKHSQPSLAFHL